MKFEDALKLVLKYEGGYVNNPADPGGETNLGVTVGVARANGYMGSMKDFKFEDAIPIYKKQYWAAVRADELPEKLRYPVFDAAVNSGVSQSIKWLQNAVNTKEDGIIGEITLKSIQSSNIDYVFRKILSSRLKCLAGLKTWNTFGKGWTNRICSILEVQ